MYIAPNLVEKQTRSYNAPRNIVFFVLCIAVIGWYGLEFSGHSDQVLEVLKNEAPKAQVGGDVVIEYVTSTVIIPVRATTNTFDNTAVTAKSFLVKDNETGETLVSKDEYAARPMASITKLMSALVLLDSGLDPEHGTTTAANGEVSDAFLQSNFVYKTKDVWNTAFVASSNRAILSLVDESGLAREEFVKRMNDKARELGMSDAIFYEPTGLGERNMASASDILLLLKVALTKKQLTDALARTQYSFATVSGQHKREIYNTNWLLLGWIPNKFYKLYPGKTGYIPASGYNFTTRIEDEHKHAIDIVVLGADSHEARFEEARDIAEWVFENFKWEEKIITVPKK